MTIGDKMDVVGRPRVWRWQMNVVGVPVFAGAGWMWFVPACVAVAVGSDWVPTCQAVADGCGSTWMWLVPTCVVMTDECVWLPRVGRWQLNVFGAHVCAHGHWM